MVSLGVGRGNPNIAESFQAGLQGAQTAQANRQSMQLRAAEEARRAQEFGWRGQDRERISGAFAGLSDFGAGAMPAGGGFDVGGMFAGAPVAGAAPQGFGLGAAPSGRGPVRPPDAPALGFSVAPRQRENEVTQQLGPMWAEFERRAGLPQGYFRRLAEVESSLDPNAKNPNSTASGLFQFLRDTAKQYGVANPMNPIEATQGAFRYTIDAVNRLRRVLGREPTAGEIYLAHQQGAGGASNLLRNPERLASEVVGRDAVRLNGGNPDTMTAGQFANMWIRKFEGGSGGAPAQTPDRMFMQPDSMQIRAGLAAPYASTLGAGVSMGETIEPEAPPRGRRRGSGGRSGDTGTDIVRRMLPGLTGAAPAAPTGRGRSAPTGRGPAATVEPTTPQVVPTIDEFDEQAAQAATTAASPLAVTTSPRPEPRPPVEVSTPAPTEAPTINPDRAASVADRFDPLAGTSMAFSAGIRPQGALSADIAQGATPSTVQRSMPGMSALFTDLPRVAAERETLQATLAMLQQQMTFAQQMQDSSLAMQAMNGMALANIRMRTLGYVQAGAAASTGNFDPMAQALSQMSGQSVQLVPRQGNTLDVVVDGRVVQQGLPSSQVISAYRVGVDEQYQQQVAAAAAQEASRDRAVFDTRLAAFKQQLEQEAIGTREERNAYVDRLLKQLFPESEFFIEKIADGVDGERLVIYDRKNIDTPIRSVQLRDNPARPGTSTVVETDVTSLR
jgi:hypothetical protein